MSISTFETVKETIDHLLDCSKGLLSVDESVLYIGVKLQEINLENNEENRRLYRQMLFQAQICDYISGIVMTHETFYQRNDDAIRFTTWFEEIGMLFGVKIDTGLNSFFKGSSEYLTEGIDNIGERMTIYKNDGCRFVKWRTVYKISDNKPSTYAIEENVHFMSRFAAVAQTQGIVPILGIEIIPEGNHSIENNRCIVEKILLTLLNSLYYYNVCIEGILIEATMIRSGDQFETPSTAQEIAQATLTAFLRTLPPALPGILLKSGGLSEEESTITLQEIVNLNVSPLPWRISFDFQSSLQQSALKTWMGKADNVAEAQEQMRKRAEAISLALQGEYVPGTVEGIGSDEDLFRKEKYSY